MESHRSQVIESWGIEIMKSLDGMNILESKFRSRESGQLGVEMDENVLRKVLIVPTSQFFNAVKYENQGIGIGMYK